MFILSYVSSLLSTPQTLEQQLTHLKSTTHLSSLAKSIQDYIYHLNLLNLALDFFATHLDDFPGSPVLVLLPLSFVEENCQKITVALSNLIGAKNELRFRLAENRLGDKVEAEVNGRIAKIYEFLARISQLTKVPSYHFMRPLAGPALKQMLAQKETYEQLSSEVPNYEQIITDWGDIHKQNAELVCHVISLRNLLKIHLSKDKPLPWVTRRW